MITLTRYHAEWNTSLKVEVVPLITQNITSTENNITPEMDINVRYKNYRQGVVEQHQTFTIPVEVEINEENIFESEFRDYVNQTIDDELDIDYFAMPTIIDAMAMAYVDMVRSYTLYAGNCSLKMSVNVEIDEFLEEIHGVTMDLDDYNYNYLGNQNYDDNNDNDVMENKGEEIRALLISSGVKFSKVSLNGTQCAVCFEAVVETESGGGEAAGLPCSHVFHGGCIVDMVLKGGVLCVSCPLCRFKVVDVPSS